MNLVFARLRKTFIFLRRMKQVLDSAPPEPGGRCGATGYLQALIIMASGRAPTGSASTQVIHNKPLA